MRLRIVLTVALVAGLAFACGGSKESTTSGSTAGSTSTGSGSGASSSGSGTTTSSSTSAGGTTATGGSGSSTTTGSNCAQGSCVYDNDCGGSKSCLNGCCVPTADTCNSGSCAYGNCAPGYTCDANVTDCCVPGGSGSTGGTTTGGGTTGGMCVFDGGVITSGVCNPDCDHGFHCENGTCVLNGGNGPIQVTLKYGNFDDLDLHVVQPDNCEVWYGNTDCTNGGSLDLDSNAGCGASTVDAENVIYTPLDAGGAVPPSGTYTVRVDMFENCDNASSIPYQVIVRHNGVTDTYCMGFDGTPGTPYPGDDGAAGSGVTVGTFTYP